MAQCRGKLLNWCGAALLFVSVLVWCVLGYPVRGLCHQWYPPQVLEVAVLCHVHWYVFFCSVAPSYPGGASQSYVFELWSVVCVLVFGMRVRVSIAVRVAVGLLLLDVLGVHGAHASECYQ